VRRATYDFDFLCLGSGPASQRAAVQAAKKGKRVAVVERNGFIGGVCVHSGTIPSKTFREAALALAHDSPFGHGLHNRYGANGSGAVSLLASGGGLNGHDVCSRLFGRVSEIEFRETRVLEHQLHRNGIACLGGTASFVDPHRLLIRNADASRTVGAGKIFIGVGSKVARPKDIPVDGRYVVTSDEILQLKELPRTLIVVGAGVVGIEYASILAVLGVQVTVIDTRPRPLEFLDNEIFDELVHQMRDRNVRFHLGETVSRVEVSSGTPRRAVVYLDSGKKVVKDMALFSAGRVGATDELDLAAAGLEADGRGRIKVNARFQTKVAHIYAGGDVIGFPSLAATSSEQGRLAACHAFGIPAGKMPEHFPFGIYAVPEISMVGRTEQELTARQIPYESGVARYREIARGQILGDDSGLVKLLVHRDTRNVLGVHAIGTGATELIHIGQTVMSLGGGLDYFLQSVFNYPTLAECYKVAALDAHNKLTV
jgi:NAD(P) transhydrogenase